MDNAVDQGGKVLEQYSVMSAWPIPGLRPVEFYVSETLFHSGRYALFARTDRGMEIWLAGTFHSEDEALNIAAGLLSRADSSDPSKPLVSLVQFAGSRRGKKLNNARRAILELVRRYGYGRADLESFFQKNFVQKQSGDIMLSWERFLGKALGVVPWRDKQTQPEDAAEAAKRTETWKRFLESDFDRRIHNLAMMDSQPAFRPFMTCFDPVLYLITTNRLRWTQYVEARKRGFNAPDIPLGVNPDTVDIRGKAALWLPCFAVVGLGLPLAWSLWRLDGATTDIYAQNIGMSVVLITAVVVWPYLAVARRWGFPAAEPIGVYTEDFVQRPLLTF